MNKRVRTLLCFFRYILSKCTPERVWQFMLPMVDYMCAHPSNIETSIIIPSKLFILIHILNYTYSSLNFFPVGWLFVFFHKFFIPLIFCNGNICFILNKF